MAELEALRAEASADPEKFWARFAESEGFKADETRPNAWRYRDYVIRSLNDDKPYDRFLREQIAGDELTDYRSAERFTPEMADALTATGFLRTAVDATRFVADFVEVLTR